MSLETNSFEIRFPDTSDRNKHFAVISGFLDMASPAEVKNFIKSIKDQHEVVMERVKKVDPEIKTETE
jgi:sensor histidine kinase regulating citrate/malate metabolism